MSPFLLFFSYPPQRICPLPIHFPTHYSNLLRISPYSFASLSLCLLSPYLPFSNAGPPAGFLLDVVYTTRSHLGFDSTDTLGQILCNARSPFSPTQACSARILAGCVRLPSLPSPFPAHLPARPILLFCSRTTPICPVHPQANPSSCLALPPHADPPSPFLLSSFPPGLSSSRRISLSAR